MQMNNKCSFKFDLFITWNLSTKPLYVVSGDIVLCLMNSNMALKIKHLLKLLVNKIKTSGRYFRISFNFIHFPNLKINDINSNE